MSLKARAGRFAVLLLFMGVISESARADYSYNFTLTGTITQVDDLSTINATGQSIHLLPDIHVGDTLSATGNFTVDSPLSSQVTLYALNINPLGVQNIATTANGRILDLNDLSQGFLLSGGGFASTHPAVVPHLAGFNYDVVNNFTINGSSLSVIYFHNSLQLSNLYPSVRGTFSTIQLTPISEPSSAALMLACFAVAGGFATNSGTRS